MEVVRDWSDDAEGARVARELRSESPVWAKVLVEHSYGSARERVCDDLH